MSDKCLHGGLCLIINRSRNWLNGVMSIKSIWISSPKRRLLDTNRSTHCYLMGQCSIRSGSKGPIVVTTREWLQVYSLRPTRIIKPTLLRQCSCCTATVMLYSDRHVVQQQTCRTATASVGDSLLRLLGMVTM
jgi:hypothetical protein